MNSDRLTDVIFASGKLLLWAKNLGNLKYSNLDTILLPVLVRDLRFGDVNNDGLIDMIASSGCCAIHYFEGSKDSIFK